MAGNTDPANNLSGLSGNLPDPTAPAAAVPPGTAGAPPLPLPSVGAGSGSLPLSGLLTPPAGPVPAGPAPTAVPPGAPGAPPLPLLSDNTPTGSSGGSWLDGFINIIGAHPSASQPPQVALNVSGPAVQIDLATVKECITGYEQVLNKLWQIGQDTSPLGWIQNPGTDDASISYADRANAVGDSHRQANLTLQAAVQAHIDKLNAVVQQYEATEHGNAANIAKQA